MNDIKWILAYKYDDMYSPESMYDKQEQALEGLEYEDVRNEAYQLWEYPSGDVFLIRPDREMPADKAWSLASVDSWLPKLVLLERDANLVEDAYKNLGSS